MTVTEFHKRIRCTKLLSKLEELCDTILPKTFIFEEFWSTPSDHPIPLPNPEKMLLARQLALEIETDTSFNDRCKGKWQRYWLRCCIRDECNYFFEVFKKCGISREIDALNIIENADNYLWEVINSKEGENYYKRTVADWFLKRYNRDAARRVLNTINKTDLSLFDKFKLCYPRLIGAIFIGFLPLITQKDTWELPLTYSWFFVISLSAISLLMTYLYFRYEYHKVAFDKNQYRPLKVCTRGVVYSLLMSCIINILFTKQFLNEKAGYWFSPLFPDFKIFPEVWLFFASSALLIGIFIQVFWEEKTVTEPL